MATPEQARKHWSDLYNRLHKEAATMIKAVVPLDPVWRDCHADESFPTHKDPNTMYLCTYVIIRTTTNPETKKEQSVIVQPPKTVLDTEFNSDVIKMTECRDLLNTNPSWKPSELSVHHTNLSLTVT